MLTLRPQTRHLRIAELRQTDPTFIDANAHEAQLQLHPPIPHHASADALNASLRGTLELQNRVHIDKRGINHGHSSGASELGD